jgi:hypothetical protein
MSPILVVRVYDICLHNRMTLDNLTGLQEVKLNNCVFALAGITMYIEGHFCALIFFQGKQYWYDGLKGKLGKVPANFSEQYFPSHVLLCRVI